MLTPVAKAFSTDIGIEVSSLGVQVHGGMGFIEETGAAQHLRDARITTIYEGTTGIQANDLVGRKMGREGGGTALSLLVEIEKLPSQLGRSQDAQLIAIGEALAMAAAVLGSLLVRFPVPAALWQDLKGQGLLPERAPVHRHRFGVDEDPREPARRLAAVDEMLVAQLNGAWGLSKTAHGSEQRFTNQITRKEAFFCACMGEQGS